jgi:hypothetical protein
MLPIVIGTQIHPLVYLRHGPLCVLTDALLLRALLRSGELLEQSGTPVHDAILAIWLQGAARTTPSGQENVIYLPAAQIQSTLYPVGPAFELILPTMTVGAYIDSWLSRRRAPSESNCRGLGRKDG